MGCGGTVEYLVDAVFNYPTFSEAYKVAALDVMNKLRALNQFGARCCSRRQGRRWRGLRGHPPAHADTPPGPAHRTIDEYDSSLLQPHRPADRRPLP